MPQLYVVLAIIYHMSTKEQERLRAVDRFLKLELSKEKQIQEIVELAADICGTPTAMVTLLDSNTQYIKFKIGCNLDTTTRQDAFCNHLIEQDEVMVVTDALKDERFINSSLVTGDTNVRFYAGVPLTTHDGHNLGGLCVVGQTPKQLSEGQQQILRVLSNQVINLLEFDSSLEILKEQVTEAKNAENKLRSFFESFNSLYVLIGKNLEILDFNKASASFVEKKFKVKVEAGMKMTDFIHQPLDVFMVNFNTALSGHPVTMEHQVKYTDETVWWSTTNAPAYSADGEIIGVSYKATDITQTIAYAQKVFLAGRIAAADSLYPIARVTPTRSIDNGFNAVV